MTAVTDISAPKTVYGVAEDRRWLGSGHGTTTTRTVTLDVSTFTKATHFPNGLLKSGTVLGRITATGFYGPYNNAATDGREVAAGHLFNSVAVAETTDPDQGAPLQEHGVVVEALLPAGHGLDAAAKVDLAGRFAYC